MEIEAAEPAVPSTQIQAQVVRPVNPEELDQWYKDHGIAANAEGIFSEMPYEAAPVSREDILKQVAENALRHDVPNLHPNEYTPKIMVYVGGGPTLRDHLDQVKMKCEDDRYEVYTSNRTAEWLLSKGVKVNYHLILDPNERKVKDLAYDADIDLILGLQCHPKLFDLAKEKGRRVKKFLAASVTGEDGMSDRVAAQPACTADDPKLLGIGGGSMCGTRMIYFAAASGYRRIEYYGFDGCVELGENNVVKCYAYSKPRGEHILETEASNGRKFFTTMSLARQGEELVKMLDQMPGMDVEIYGDSLLRNQLEIYREARAPSPARFTPEYLEQQRMMHASIPGQYGIMGANSAPRVFMAAAQVSRKLGYCKVLDYGCGGGGLKKAMEAHFPSLPNVWVSEYDPAVPGFDSEPSPAEVVFCGDVMEHVEPECVDAVLAHIHSLTKSVAIFVIDLNLAAKTLPDGRNAHLTIRGRDWWLSYLRKYFVVIEAGAEGGSLLAVCQGIPS